MMNVRIASAPPRPGARAGAVSLAAVSLTAVMLAVAAGSPVLAQAPAAPPAAPAPKAQPKAQPKAPPQQAPAPAPAQAGGPEAPPLTYSPWTKVCVKGQEVNAQQAQQVCFIGKDGRMDTGMLIVGAVLIEPEGAPSKVLRITLPLGMLIPQGTRVIVDQGQPMTAPYMMCLPTGCVAEYEASGELIGKLKKGQSMVVQGINGQNQMVSVPLPLPDFAKAYDGPATDPKVLEERQKKQMEEFQKKQQQQQQAVPK
jgi:invasion protein IalB